MFVNGKKLINSKQKILRLAKPLFLRNIWKDWTVDNMKETGLNGNVYDFSLDFDAIVVDDTLDIHNCFMKKIDIVQQNVWVY